MTRFVARSSNSALIALIGALAIALIAAVASKSTAAGAELRVTGGEETVFSWARQRCDTWDIPDTPARAFRDADGQVHLFSSHTVARALIGPNFAALTRDCRPVFEGAGNDDPEAFDDRVWLASVWTADGRTVHGLAHAEYQGQRRPKICPAANYRACWNNAVVQLLSTDGGRTFVRDGGPERAPVATLPWRYDPSAGHPTGYFSPTNIIAWNGYLYAFIFATHSGAQGYGACLLRTDNIDDPQSWRAWDGRDFTIDFANPALGPVDDVERHLCAPLPSLPRHVNSVVRLAGRDEFVALFSDRIKMAGHDEPVRGIFWADSTDLLHWSAPKLLHAVATFNTRRCDDSAVYNYPSLIDGNSPSRTFDTVGATASLYLTRFNQKDCKIGADRDLVRLPVSIESVAR